MRCANLDDIRHFVKNRALRSIGSGGAAWAGEASGDEADEGADGGHEEEHDGYVGGFDSHGIGGDGELRGVAVEAYQPECLLQEAETHAEDYACRAAEHGYEPAFPEKHSGCEPGSGSEGAEGGHVVAFLDDEHREGGDDVKRGYDEDEGEHEEGYPLLDGYHPE